MSITATDLIEYMSKRGITVSGSTHDVSGSLNSVLAMVENYTGVSVSAQDESRVYVSPEYGWPVLEVDPLFDVYSITIQGGYEIPINAIRMLGKPPYRRIHLSYGLPELRPARFYTVHVSGSFGLENSSYPLPDDVKYSILEVASYRVLQREFVRSAMPSSVKLGQDTFTFSEGTARSTDGYEVAVGNLYKTLLRYRRSILA